MENAGEKENGLKTLGGRLKLWRISKGMKGYQLAESVNVSQGSISDIENGRTLPSTRTLTQLVKLEGMDLTWLLTGHQRAAGPSEQSLSQAGNNSSRLKESLPSASPAKGRAAGPSEQSLGPNMNTEFQKTLIDNLMKAIEISRELEKGLHQLITTRRH